MPFSGGLRLCFRNFCKKSWPSSRPLVSPKVLARVAAERCLSIDRKLLCRCCPVSGQVLRPPLCLSNYLNILCASVGKNSMYGHHFASCAHTECTGLKNWVFWGVRKYKHFHKRRNFSDQSHRGNCTRAVSSELRIWNSFLEVDFVALL